MQVIPPNLANLVILKATSSVLLSENWHLLPALGECFLSGPSNTQVCPQESLAGDKLQSLKESGRHMWAGTEQVKRGEEAGGKRQHVLCMRTSKLEPLKHRQHRSSPRGSVMATRFLFSAYMFLMGKALIQSLLYPRALQKAQNINIHQMNKRYDLKILS